MLVIGANDNEKQFVIVFDDDEFKNMRIVSDIRNESIPDVLESIIVREMEDV